MALFDIFKKKEVLPGRVNHDFDETDRQISLERRQLNAMLRNQRFEIEKLQLEQQKLELQQEIDDIKAGIAEYSSEDTDEDSGSPMEAMFMKIMTQILSKSQPLGTAKESPSSVSSLNAAMSVSPPEVELTEIQLKQIWKETPKLYKEASKKLSDEQLKGYVKQQIPNISNASLLNAIKVIRNE